MTQRSFGILDSAFGVLLAAALVSLILFGSARGAFGQEAPPTCKTAILIWVPVGGAEVPVLRADKAYVSRAACIVNKARREGAAAILDFRASAAGALPPSRCIGVRETLLAEGVASGDPLMTAAAINDAYGEELCPPGPPAADAGAGVPGGG